MAKEWKGFYRGAAPRGDFNTTAARDGIGSGELLKDANWVVGTDNACRTAQGDLFGGCCCRGNDRAGGGGRHRNRVVFAYSKVVQPDVVGVDDCLEQVADRTRSVRLLAVFELGVAEAVRADFHEVSTFVVLKCFKSARAVTPKSAGPAFVPRCASR